MAPDDWHQPGQTAMFNWFRQSSKSAPRIVPRAVAFQAVVPEAKPLTPVTRGQPLSSNYAPTVNVNINAQGMDSKELAANVKKEVGSALAAERRKQAAGMRSAMYDAAPA